jgi:neutral ceramidase
MPELQVCFRRIDITPDRPVSLLGYFTDRISEGALDRLHCRLAALSVGQERLLFAQIDSCLFGRADAERLALAASRSSGIPAERVMVFASHTHTAPGLADLYAVRRDAAYLDFLEAGISAAASDLGSWERASVRICRGRAPGLASNRRWWLENGTVATNPPRMHPALARPEGPVDDEVNTVAFHGPDGRVLGLFVSASNHVDTIGGKLVSADWPGIMEAEIRTILRTDAVVVPFMGAAGNINHFDFSRKLDQSSYGESNRIGKGYASAVLDSLETGVETSGDPLAAARRTIRLPGIEISAAELEHAREIVSRPVAAADGRDRTAEDIFAGDPGVESIFAQALLDLAAGRPEAYDVPLQLFRVGGVGFFAIPGEPFVEIGLALKALPGFDLAIPVGLANGYFGYIPMRESFGRGGYEVKPGPALLCRGAAEIVLGTFGEMAAVSARFSGRGGTGSA